MRALADELSRHAGRLGDMKSRVTKGWAKMEFEGPLADQMGAVVTSCVAQFPAAADVLDGLVKVLRSSAREVEAQQEAERRRLAAEAQRRADEQRRANEAAQTHG